MVLGRRLSLVCLRSHGHFSRSSSSTSSRRPNASSFSSRVCIFPVFLNSMAKVVQGERRTKKKLDFSFVSRAAAYFGRMPKFVMQQGNRRKNFCLVSSFKRNPYLCPRLLLRGAQLYCWAEIIPKYLNRIMPA